jgi:hypothetical protein
VVRLLHTVSVQTETWLRQMGYILASKLLNQGGLINVLEVRRGAFLHTPAGAVLPWYVLDEVSKVDADTYQHNKAQVRQPRRSLSGHE